MRTLWDSISHVWYVVSLAVTVGVRHIRHNMTRLRTVDETATHNAKRERTLYTTTPTVSKQNGYGTQQFPATYAAYPSSLVTPSKQITLMQEILLVNSNLHIVDAMQAEAVPHYHQPHSHHTHRQTQPTTHTNN